MHGRWGGAIPRVNARQVGWGATSRHVLIRMRRRMPKKCGHARNTSKVTQIIIYYTPNILTLLITILTGLHYTILTVLIYYRLCVLLYL